MRPHEAGKGNAPRPLCVGMGPPMSNNPRYGCFNERVKLRKRLRAMGITRCMNPKCGCVLDWDHPYRQNSAEIDEIVPISKLPKEMRARAAIDPRNVQVLCRKCNRTKSNKLNWDGGRDGRKPPEFETPPSPVDWFS